LSFAVKLYTNFMLTVPNFPLSLLNLYF